MKIREEPEIPWRKLLTSMNCFRTFDADFQKINLQQNTNMKNLLSILVTGMAVVLFSCQASMNDENEPLEGVWELVSAEWQMGDSTSVFPGPDMTGKSIKGYTDGHFFVMGDMGDVYALSGTYTISGDTCIEVIGMNTFGMDPGENVTIVFSTDGDNLNLKSDWFEETWKRIE